MSAASLAGVVAVPVQWHVLITGFGGGAPTLVADAVLVATASWYLVAVWRLSSRGRRWSPLAGAAFFGGLLVLFVAIGSGLAAYDDDNFSVHVVQHVLLMMVAPPLLVLGRPVRLFLQASGRRWQSVGVRLLQRLGGVLTGVAVTAAYFGFMWLYFLTPLYAWSVRSEVLHDTVHVVCVALGLAYWDFVVGREGAAARRHHAGDRLWRVAALIVGMPFEMYLGFALRAHGRPLGPGTTVASVQAGGELFWWLTMLLSGIALAVVLGEWVITDERAALRLDRSSGSGLAPGWSAPAEGNIVPTARRSE